MKRSLIVFGLLLVSGFLVSQCGGGGGAQDPEEALAEFENPTGTITAENADEVMNELVDSGLADSGTVGGFGGFEFERHGLVRIASKRLPLFGQELDVIDCMDAEDDYNYTLDIGCAAAQDPDCYGSGTLKYTTAGDLVKIELDHVSISCLSIDLNIADWDGEFLFLFSGEVRGSTTYPGLVLYCAAVSGAINGQSQSFNGCATPEGDFLMTGEGGKVVMTGAVANDVCSKICADFRTGNGPVSVTCDVTETDGGCTGWESAENVVDCVVAAIPCAL